MSFEVFLANLPANITEERVRELCTPFGEVVKVDFTAEPWVLAVIRVAMVELALAEGQKPMKVLKALNQVEAAPGWPVFASPVTPLKFSYTREEFTRVIETLNETSPQAHRHIRDFMIACGPFFVPRLLEKALAVEASGGMLTLDGTRRRTPGGTFLQLARCCMSPRLRADVFPSRTEIRRRERARHERIRAVYEQRAAQTSGEPVLTVQAPPPPPEVALDEPRSRLAELRLAVAESLQLVEQIKAGTASVPGGFFAAAKRVVDLQKQVAALLQEYPALRDEAP